MLACMTSASINRSRQLLVSHVGIDADDAHQRTGYFAALNRVQKHHFPFDPASGGYLLVFAAPDADTEATMRHFLDVDGLTEDHLYGAAERERIAAGMLEGSRILRRLAAPYAQVVSELTGAFVFARMRGAGGGSQGDVLGAHMVESADRLGRGRLCRGHPARDGASGAVSRSARRADIHRDVRGHARRGRARDERDSQDRPSVRPRVSRRRRGGHARGVLRLQCAAPRTGEGPLVAGRPCTN